jgi:hypothetical protein
MQLGKRNDAESPQRGVRVPRQALRHFQRFDVICVPAEEVGQGMEVVRAPITAQDLEINLTWVFFTWF